MVSEATFCQVSEPPPAVGRLGAVRSRRTVEPAVGVLGTQFEVRPATSTARNCTSVSPSAVMVAVEPVTGADHAVPPSVEVRYWYEPTPEPGESAEPAAVTAVEAALRQLS